VVGSRPQDSDDFSLFPCFVDNFTTLEILLHSHFYFDYQNIKSLCSRHHCVIYPCSYRARSVCVFLLETGSLNNAIREFSLAYPSWIMSHYTMFFKYGKRARDFLRRFYSYLTLVFFIFGGVLNKTVISLALVGYDMITAVE